MRPVLTTVLTLSLAVLLGCFNTSPAWLLGLTGTFAGFYIEYLMPVALHLQCHRTPCSPASLCQHTPLHSCLYPLIPVIGAMLCSITLLYLF